MSNLVKNYHNIIRALYDSKTTSKYISLPGGILVPKSFDIEDASTGIILTGKSLQLAIVIAANANLKATLIPVIFETMMMMFDHITDDKMYLQPIADIFGININVIYCGLSDTTNNNLYIGCGEDPYRLNETHCYIENPKDIVIFKATDGNYYPYIYDLSKMDRISDGLIGYVIGASIELPMCSSSVFFTQLAKNASRVASIVPTVVPTESKKEVVNEVVELTTSTTTTQVVATVATVAPVTPTDVMKSLALSGDIDAIESAIEAKIKFSTSELRIIGVRIYRAGLDMVTRELIMKDLRANSV